MQLAVSRVSTFRALSWIKNGWRLFTQRPGPFMAMSGILMAIQLGAGLVPLASFLVVFLLPFLTIGYFQIASKVEQDETVSATDIFYYLGRISEYSVLIRIALVSIVLGIPASMAGSNMMESMMQQQSPALGDLVLFVFFMGLNFMATAFSVPAAWVSPKTSVKVLVFQSFQAGWQNVMPLTIYGILVLSIGLISSPVILIGWLIAFSVSNLSFYHAFLDIFQPVAESDDLDTDDNDIQPKSNVVNLNGEDEVQIESAEQDADKHIDSVESNDVEQTSGQENVLPSGQHIENEPNPGKSEVDSDIESKDFDGLDKK